MQDEHVGKRVIGSGAVKLPGKENFGKFLSMAATDRHGQGLFDEKDSRSTCTELFAGVEVLAQSVYGVPVNHRTIMLPVLNP